MPIGGGNIMTPLTESEKKLLTEFLGECWHDRLIPVHASGVCRHCNIYMDDWNDVIQRTFTAWQDLGDLKEELVKKGMWLDFWMTSRDPWQRRVKHWDDYASWDEYLFNPAVFIPLCIEFLRKEAKYGSEP
jgi:hypothetical protein